MTQILAHLQQLNSNLERLDWEVENRNTIIQTAFLKALADVVSDTTKSEIEQLAMMLTTFNKDADVDEVGKAVADKLGVTSGSPKESQLIDRVNFELGEELLGYVSDLSQELELDASITANPPVPAIDNIDDVIDYVKRFEDAIW